MPDRSSSARVFTPPPEQISPAGFHSAFHRICGKFCAEVTQVAGKCLFLKRFFWFEPECSKSVKPVVMRGLPCISSNCNGFNPRWLFGAEFDRISTVRQVAARKLKANAERATR